MTKKEENKEEKVLTRAQKTTATKEIIRELLAAQPMKHNELIDEVAKRYTARYEGQDTENANDVRGRVGSVLDIMKKESDVMYDGGMYALKARLPLPPVARKGKKTADKEPSPVAEEVVEVEAPAEKPVKSRAKKKAISVKEESPANKAETAPERVKEEGAKEAAPKKRTRTKKTEKAEALPVAETPAATEKPAPKKRGRKPKAAEKVEETTAKAEVPTKEDAVSAKEEAPAQKVETVPVRVEERAEIPAPQAEKSEEKQADKQENTELVVKPKAEVVQKGVVMDMSFLFGDKTPKTPAKREEKSLPAEKKEGTKVALNGKKAPAPVEKTVPVSAAQKTVENKAENKTVAPQKTEKPASKGQPTQKAEPAVEKSAEKAEDKPATRGTRRTARDNRSRQTEKPMTADEKLRDEFLKRMRTLGGDYFEYYSVYLLERYSMKNGRRLEGLRISGGDHDGGIDGEIELTDKLGFKETIYIQSKNWDPEKGKEENWVVGETLLQQFIGACACRQAKEGKQHCRGIFITTSRFTPDAKKILEDMSEKIVGYDGNDLYEAAKECSFGLVQRNGNWTLDEKLLSGTKAFFQML